MSHNHKEFTFFISILKVSISFVEKLEFLSSMYWLNFTWQYCISFLTDKCVSICLFAVIYATFSFSSKRKKKKKKRKKRMITSGKRPAMQSLKKMHTDITHSRLDAFLRRKEKQIAHRRCSFYFYFKWRFEREKWCLA